LVNYILTFTHLRSTSAYRAGLPPLLSAPLTGTRAAL